MAVGEWARLRPNKNGYYWVIYANNTYGIVWYEVDTGKIFSAVPQADNLIMLWKGPLVLPSLQRVVEKGIISSKAVLSIMEA